MTTGFSWCEFFSVAGGSIIALSLAALFLVLYQRRKQRGMQLTSLAFVLAIVVSTIVGKLLARSICA